MDFQTLKLELQKRCLDLGMVKRPDARYGEILNVCITQYPRSLWQIDLNTSLDTVEDQLEYSLATVSELTAPENLRRVFIDDADGVARETGRWWVKTDVPVTRWLVLDEPPTGAYDITLEMWIPPEALTTPTSTTYVDDDWLLAKAMIALMGEADWTIDNPEQVIRSVEFWNAQLLTIERRLRAERRRTSRKPRTTAWRQYVK